MAGAIEMRVLETAFLLFAGVIVYSYLFYPALIAVLAGIFARKHGRAPVEARECKPSVTVIVAAHNEEAVIAERIENLFATSYPGEKLEMIIASDGSSDSTEQIVASCETRYPRLRLLAHSPNRGKAYTLNRAIPAATGDVIVLSDANTAFAPDAIDRLVARLDAPDAPIAVCGKLVLKDPATGNNVDSLYWRYESWIKAREGDLGAALGANGAIYAFRRADYVPIADNTIIDDFTIPLLMKLRHGGAVVFEPAAVAEEWAPDTLADEFGRRVRLGTGAYQSLAVLWPLLHPRNGLIAFCFLSHKVLRWLVPFCLLGLLLVTALGIREPLFQLSAVGFAILGVLLLTRDSLPHGGLAGRVARLATMFVAMNAALLAGFWKWLRRPATGSWARTER